MNMFFFTILAVSIYVNWFKYFWEPSEVNLVIQDGLQKYVKLSSTQK
jgi:hypothetical protein